MQLYDKTEISFLYFFVLTGMFQIRNRLFPKIVQDGNKTANRTSEQVTGWLQETIWFCESYFKKITKTIPRYRIIFRSENFSLYNTLTSYIYYHTKIRYENWGKTWLKFKWEKWDLISSIEKVGKMIQIIWNDWICKSPK